VRLAWITVGSAFLGTSVVLLSMGRTEAQSPPPVPAVVEDAPAGGPDRPAAIEPEVRSGARGEPGSCPPCQGAPLDAEAWKAQLGTLDGAVALERASSLSAALPDAHSIAGALVGDDPALRSLATLLLNVGSRRVNACQAIGSLSVLQVLDRLDHLARSARDGGKPSAAALAASSAQADAVSRGGIPGCGP
jgi:hypothetical protein